MFLIDCPWCGERDQSEFKCGGEAHIRRPAAPAALSDAEWADYVFFRTNPKGIHFERWAHVHGCRRWFNVARDTANDVILLVYPIDAPAPADLVARAPATPCGEPAAGSGLATVETGGATAAGEAGR
ncbi:MAG: sarcosine oxidase subunit delta [Azospirillaceae bacterium]